MGAAAIPIAIGTQVAGGFMQYQGARAQGKAEKAYYNFLARQAEGDAEEVLATGEREVTNIQDAAGRTQGVLTNSVKELEGRQAVVQAANGVGGGSVTTEDIARDTLNKQKMDEMVIKFNADAKSYETRIGASEEAGALREGAIMNRAGGMNAARAGRRNADASLLGTATQVASSWDRWSQTSRGRTREG